MQLAGAAFFSRTNCRRWGRRRCTDKAVIFADTVPQRYENGRQVRWPTSLRHDDNARRPALPPHRRNPQSPMRPTSRWARSAPVVGLAVADHGVVESPRSMQNGPDIELVTITHCAGCSIFHTAAVGGKPKPRADTTAVHDATITDRAAVPSTTSAARRVDRPTGRRNHQTLREDFSVGINHSITFDHISGPMLASDPTWAVDRPLHGDG